MVSGTEDPFPFTQGGGLVQGQNVKATGETRTQTPSAPPASPGAPSSTGTGLPDPQSAEMYRIAAALSTEGSGPQSTVDMMQVVVNRKASGRYGKTYTEILSAGTGGKNVAFEGVWKRPGGPGAFRKIQTIEDAVRWSGQSKSALLRIISDIQNPTLQANSAKFVGGAFDFRASPQNNPSGRLPGTAWRGGAGDNQFLTDSSRGDPIRKEGPAPFNLPAPQAQVSSSPRSNPVSNPPSRAQQFFVPMQPNQPPPQQQSGPPGGSGINFPDVSEDIRSVLEQLQNFSLIN